MPTSQDPATGGDEFPNDGNTRIRVSVASSGSADPTYVVILAQSDSNQGYRDNVQMSVAAGATEVAGPFPRDRWSDSEGNVQLRYYSDSALSTALTGAQATAVDLEVVGG